MDKDQTKGLDRTAGMECRHLRPDGLSAGECELIVEEPLQIIVDGWPVATLMSTPGDEMSLALGFLYTEGIVNSGNEIGAIAFCREEFSNAVRVVPAEGINLQPRLSAHRAVFSSCSICGTEAIEAVASRLQPFAGRKGRLRPRAIFDLGAQMSREQRFFKRTGGTHAAALGRVEGGMLLPESIILKEDIGRHNALDKAVGEALMKKTPFKNALLFLSGRMSFEMVAKAARAGISDVAAVSAPTALAVELARRLNMFLAGFARGESAVVYSGEEAVRTFPDVSS